MAVLLGSWALVLIPLALWMNRQRTANPYLPEEERFLAVSARLKSLGLERGFGESPLMLLSETRARLAADHPVRRDLEAAVAALYSAAGKSS